MHVIIIGSGPAGISAALYARRGGADVTIVTKGVGTLAAAEWIENYYGFPEPITGAELEQRGIDGAKRLGVRFVWRMVSFWQRGRKEKRSPCRAYRNSRGAVSVTVPSAMRSFIVGKKLRLLEPVNMLCMRHRPFSRMWHRSPF